MDKWTEQKWHTATFAEAYAGTDDITSPAAIALIQQAGLLNTDLSSSRILDLGAGLGVVTKALYGLLEGSASAPVEIVCGDVDKGLLEVIEGYKRSQSWGNVTIKELDATTNYSPPASFQYIIANFVFFLLMQPEAALKEAYTALAPGGTLAFSTWAYSGPFHLCQLAQANLLDSPPSQPLPPQITNWGNPTFVQKTLEDAGFVDIQINILNFRQKADSPKDMAKKMLIAVMMYTRMWGEKRESQGWQILCEIEKAMEREPDVSITSVALIVTAKKA